MAAALTNLGAETAVIDGELICVGADGRADFYGLMRQMRSSNLDESALQVMAFDLLFQDGVDLRGLPLSERLRDLGRLPANRACPLSSWSKASRSVAFCSITTIGSA